MDFLIAPDSFKGTYSAPEVAEALAIGVREEGASADICPVADGGEGTAETLLAALGGESIEVPAHDPLGRPIEARIALLDNGRTAAVDVAAASGLPLLAPEERDAEAASTYGTGELIAAAIGLGAQSILIAAGGSATTDGGRGAIEAMCERGGAGGATLEVLCDVHTPFERAAIVFGPQKGADNAAVKRLTKRLLKLAAELPKDPRGRSMTGCAGGLSGGLWAAFGARLHPGAETVFQQVGIEARLERAQAAISGEGRLDNQSLEGKVVGSLIKLCGDVGRPLHAVVGSSALSPEGADSAGLASLQIAGDLSAFRAAGRKLALSALREA